MALPAPRRGPVATAGWLLGRPGPPRRALCLISRAVHAGTYIPKWLELLVSDAWTVVCGGHSFPAVKGSTAAGPWAAPPWCLLPSACLRSRIYELLPSAVARTPGSSQGPLSSQAPRVLLGTAETGTHCPGCWGHTLGTDCWGHTAQGHTTRGHIAWGTGDTLLEDTCPGVLETDCQGHTAWFPWPWWPGRAHMRCCSLQCLGSPGGCVWEVVHAGVLLPMAPSAILLSLGQVWKIFP